MFEVGDVVKVVDNEKCYSTYIKFFHYHHIEQFLPFYGEYKEKGEDTLMWLDFGFNNCATENDFYEIMFIGQHSECCFGDLAVISTLDYSKVFLIGVEGIKKVKE